GADQTLAARYGSAAARNGEPFGELGVVVKQDAAWGDQRGNPRDPQAGNAPGGQIDIRVSSGTQPINSPGTCCDPPVAGASIRAPRAPALRPPGASAPPAGRGREHRGADRIRDGASASGRPWGGARRPVR